MATLDEAMEYLLRYAANPPRTMYSSYGYDIFLSNVIRAYAMDTEHIDQHEAEQQVRPLSPIFMDAAWELCRMGILRPGVRQLGEQSTDGDGEGFSLTDYGSEFVANPSRPILALLPGRFVDLIKPMLARFGAGFGQRATEGLRCYRAGAYLASCAMWGAAAESILLAVAIAKSGDERGVLANYRSSGGRLKVINLVVGNAPVQITNPFRSATQLLSYWRDEASHGLASAISEVEAHEAVVQLIRFAQFANDNWEALTRSP